MKKKNWVNNRRKKGKKNGYTSLSKIRQGLHLVFINCISQQHCSQF